MVDTNFRQYRMLKKINKLSALSTAGLTEEELDICSFLCKHEFLEVDHQYHYTPNGEIDIFGLYPSSYSITQSGKAQISAYESSFHKWWIPVVISVISLIVSLISLLC